MIDAALGLADHDPTGRLAAEEDAFQVDGDDPVEVVLGRIEERALDHDAGDVAPDVDATLFGRHPRRPARRPRRGPRRRARPLRLLPPAALTSWAVASAESAWMSAHSTEAPAPPSANAVARPIPLPAPVTTATLPSTRKDSMRVVASIEVPSRSRCRRRLRRPRRPRRPVDWSCSARGRCACRQ